MPWTRFATNFASLSTFILGHLGFGNTIRCLFLFHALSVSMAAYPSVVELWFVGMNLYLDMVIIYHKVQIGISMDLYYY